jgi:hypothetical protein
MIERQMRHLNNNALCAIYIETTGDNPRLHDIVEICIMLVDNFIRPSREIMPFYNQVVPFRAENIDFDTCTIPRAKLAACIRDGLEPSLAADRLEEWHGHLGLPKGKKIVPLTLNWPYMREYLHTWLGFENCRHLFAEEYRDIMSTALHINDCRNMQAREWVYPKPHLLSYLGNQHSVEVRKSDDVMEKTLKMIEIYRLMLSVHF